MCALVTLCLKSVTVAGRGGARRRAGQERRVLWAVAAEGDGPSGLHRAGTKSRLEFREIWPDLATLWACLRDILTDPL